MPSSAELPVVWFFDDNDDELKTYGLILRRLLDGRAEVRLQQPHPTLSEYLPMLSDAHTGCVITDQQLKVTGIATYTGIELAEYIRGANRKVPVYVLTNFADDRDPFIDGEWTVEDIIPKSHLVDQHHRQVVAARLVRRLDTYRDIVDSRIGKLQQLLQRSAEGELGEDELAELDALWVEQNSPTLVHELSRVQQLEQLMRTHAALIQELEQFDQGDAKHGR